MPGSPKKRARQLAQALHPDTSPQTEHGAQSPEAVTFLAGASGGEHDFEPPLVYPDAVVEGSGGAVGIVGITANADRHLAPAPASPVVDRTLRLERLEALLARLEAVMAERGIEIQSYQSEHVKVDGAWTTQRIGVKRIDEALVRQYRGVLNDIAGERGELIRPASGDQAIQVHGDKVLIISRDGLQSGV